MQFQLSDTNMDIMNSSTSDSERLSVVNSAASNPTSQTPQNQILKEHQHLSDEGDNNNKTTAKDHNKQHQEQEAEAEISIIGLIVEHDADATSDDICFDISMGIERFHQSEIILEDDIFEGEEGDDDACDQKDAGIDDYSQQDFEIPLPPQDEDEGADDNTSDELGRLAPSCSVLLRQAQSKSSSDLTDDSDYNSNETSMSHNGDRRSLLARNKANSVAAIKCCTTRRAFSDHDAIILSNIDEDEEEAESTNDDFEVSLARMSMDHQRRYTGGSSSHYSYSNRRQSNDSYASAYSTRGRRRSSMASTQSGATPASGGRARRRSSRRMSTECHDSLILDELSAMVDATTRREQASKSKCNPNDGSVDTIATAATSSSSASTFRRPSMLASAIENNDYYQRQPVANEDLYAYDGSCIITKLNRSIARDWDMSGGCPLKDQARRRKNTSRRSTMI